MPSPVLRAYCGMIANSVHANGVGAPELTRTLLLNRKACELATQHGFID